jgi:predicted ATP-grasp superfamily ATP-dependent carboligase
METILLLGGRAPATLELARGFYRAGHRVVVADSVPLTLTGASRTVTNVDTLPSPAQALEAFAQALDAIIKREGITFLLPTCEEIFHVARICDQLPSICRVFVPPLTDLHHVHHKGYFVEMALGYGLDVPETYTIENPTGLHPFLENSREWVFKPAYSRFAGKTLVCPSHQKVLNAVHPTRTQPWVVQQFIPGRQICTYSIAQNGRLTAHCAYPTEWTAGQGATVAFRSIDHPTSRAWVEQFAAKSQWTGQIAFDFIEQAEGSVLAIECNPRATSGVHLLASHPHFVRAYLDADISCVTPAPHTGAMVGGGMLFYGFPTVRNRKQWQAWRNTFSNSRDVVWRGDDPKPWLWQWLALGMFVGRAMRLGISPLEATTWDIEWNGEM